MKMTQYLFWTSGKSLDMSVTASAFICKRENKLGLGDMAQKIITIIIFISVDIDNYHDKCQIFISFKFHLKPDVCSKVKVLETRPLIFLNTIII